MAGNTFGKLFAITTFGESHGNCVGIIIDGCPAGLAVTAEDIQREVDKRRPGTWVLATTRAEEEPSIPRFGHSTRSPLGGR